MINKLITRFKEGIYLHHEKIRVKGIPFSYGHIAHISDLHFDQTGKFPKWTQKAVYDFLYHELHPVQILCVTGDLIDGSTNDIEEAIAWLNNLPVNYVICSIGNHDEKYVDEIFEYYQGCPYNNKVILGINRSFEFNGIVYHMFADLKSKYFDPKLLHRTLDPNKPNIILTHNPEGFWPIIQECQDYNVPLILSGHTHGGQIGHADTIRKLFAPFISRGKILNILRINHEHDCFKLHGSYKTYDYHLHINVGLGSHPPGRLFCPPTITEYLPND